MSNALPKARCIEPGCRGLTKGNRCDDHGGTRKGTASQRGYGQGWRIIRAAHLALHPHCVVCTKVATVVDHVHPRRVEAAAGRNPDREANLQSLCVRHHNAKSGSGQ